MSACRSGAPNDHSPSNDPETEPLVDENRSSETPSPGTLWRMHGSKGIQQIVSVNEGRVRLRSLKLETYTSLTLEQFNQRCTFVGRLRSLD